MKKNIWLPVVAVLVLFSFLCFVLVRITMAAPQDSDKDSDLLPKNVIFISENPEKEVQKGVRVNNITADKWDQISETGAGDVIWVKGKAPLKNESVKQYLQKKLQEGIRIYFVNKQLSIEEIFSYFNVSDYPIKTGDGTSPHPEEAKSPLSTEVLGVQKYDSFYGIFALRFETPANQIVIKSLAQDSQQDPLAKFRNAAPNNVSTTSCEDWPIKYVHSVTDRYIAGTVSFAYKLSAHPTNPVNTKYYYCGKQVLEVTRNSEYTIDYIYPTISAGSNGKVYDYSPNAATSNNSITVSLPYAVTRAFSVGNLGSGLSLKTAKYCGGIGDTYTEWQGEALNPAGVHNLCLGVMRAEPGMEFFIDPSQANVRAYSSYTVNWKYYGSTTTKSNSFDTWVPK